MSQVKLGKSLANRKGCENVLNTREGILIDLKNRVQSYLKIITDSDNIIRLDNGYNGFGALTIINFSDNALTH